MKASRDIPRDMLENKKEFENDFFKRFKLRPASAPLQLTDDISKDYLFPTFYGDVTCAMAISLCSYDKARALVKTKLGQSVEPVKMPGKRAVVAFSCYEYKRVMGVNPYNEIAVAIPVMVNARFNPPLLPMVIDKFSHFGYYIAAMPVTSHENTLRGHKIWNLPKETQAIDVYRKGSDCITEARDDNDETYLKVRVPMSGKPADFDVSSYLITNIDGRIVRSETNFKARFNVNKNMGVLFGKGSTEPFIEISNSPAASVLNELEIQANPFQFRYAEHMSSCFDLPDENSPAWLKNAG